MLKYINFYYMQYMHIYAYNTKKTATLNVYMLANVHTIAKGKMDISQINKHKSGVSYRFGITWRWKNFKNVYFWVNYCFEVCFYRFRIVCNQMVTEILKGDCHHRMLLLILALILTCYRFHIIDHWEEARAQPESCFQRGGNAVPVSGPQVTHSFL